MAGDKVTHCPLFIAAIFIIFVSSLAVWPGFNPAGKIPL
jgi:hypothetical protein